MMCVNLKEICMPLVKCLCKLSFVSNIFVTVSLKIVCKPVTSPLVSNL